MIGILAGMGPKSTAPFIDIVVDKCQEIYGAKYDIEFPHMMIYSCPTPFYIDREIDHVELENSIVEGAKKLESTGVQFIAMPCNTAHLYLDKIRDSLSIPLLDMVAETVKEIPETAKAVALLATEATVQSGIYQKYLKSSGFECVHNNDWQEKVTNTIKHIKRGDIQVAKNFWNDILNDLNERVDTIIIACTDLNVVLDKQERFNLVDSSACLAKALVNKYLSLSPTLLK